MRFLAFMTAIFFLFASLVISVAWRNQLSRATSSDPQDDSHLGTALTFSHAVYVKDWDNTDVEFVLPSREQDGTFRLSNNFKDSSKAFNRLAKNGWHLYFNEIRATGHTPQDTQILTGSKMESKKLTFVIAFRGSDKPEDYLYTNCKHEPIPLDALKQKSLSPGLSGDNMGKSSDTPIIASVISGAWTAWVSNLRSGSPALVHRGYTEQACSALSAKIIDPADMSQLTIVEALSKYPKADFILTGHSSGGAAAHILAALADELGLNQHGRIRVRTFAAAGAFNKTAQQRYEKADSINYVIAGDPILFANSFSGYGPIGLNILIPASANISNYSRTVHEMTAYEERLKNH